MKAHPNTQVMLDAWRRLAEGGDAVEGPAADEHPGLISSLFVLNHVGERDFAFRRTGLTLERLFSRALMDHNFLSIWLEADRNLVAAALALAVRDRGPMLIHARGETLTGKRIDIEFALAPLQMPEQATPRFLGLCQTITPEDVLNGRPIRSLQAVAVYPPAPPQKPAISIVACADR